MRTGTLTDYMVPTANEIPEMVLERTVTPSPSNELGVKGIGEAGTIAASAPVINAICDALAPFGIKHIDMPASPGRLGKPMDNPPRRVPPRKEAPKETPPPSKKPAPPPHHSRPHLP